MGLFSGRDNTAGRAAEQQIFARRDANKRLQAGFDTTAGEFGGRQGQLREDFLRQRGQTEEGFQPFIGAGQDALGQLQQGSTAQGFNDLLAQITGGGQFQALQDLQRREAEGHLSSSGLGGSGLGVQTLSEIGPRLALQLAGKLRSRQTDLAKFGFQGTSQRGQLGNQLFGQQGQLSSALTQQLGGFRQNLAAGQTQNIAGIGEARSQAIIGDASANKGNKILKLVGTVAGAYFGGPAGAKLGGEIGDSI